MLAIDVACYSSMHKLELETFDLPRWLRSSHGGSECSCFFLEQMDYISSSSPVVLTWRLVHDSAIYFLPSQAWGLHIWEASSGSCYFKKEIQWPTLSPTRPSFTEICSRSHWGMLLTRAMCGSSWVTEYHCSRLKLMRWLLSGPGL